MPPERSSTWSGRYPASPVIGAVVTGEDSRRIAPAGVLRRRGPDTTTPRWLAAAGCRRANIPLMLRAPATQAGRVSVREVEALLTRAGGASRLPRRFRFLGCVGRYGHD